MAIKIVYRILRTVSDWTLWGFFSEVSVEGRDNVPPNGPLILTPSHHNEIIDIATLSVTIPHRRHISFWAKASMFANPVARQIMLSSGALLVSRGRKTDVDGTSSPSSDGIKLHESTFENLAADEPIAIFPEGTSYTEPRIVQVKEGAARVGLEYVRWCRANKSKSKVNEGIIIVPVGIVYTDKSQYRSRVAVKYGRPIVLDGYVEEFCSSDEQDSRAAVRRLCDVIAEHLKELTINAPDWQSLYAAQMARDMIYSGNKTLPLREFTKISQRLVVLFSSPEIAEDVKKSLLHYHALLHHTNFSHSSLSPIPFSSGHWMASKRTVTIALIKQSVQALVYLPLFLPAFVAHVPAYVLGTVAAKQLAPKYEEARAQFKGIVGGIGMGLGCSVVGRIGWQWLKKRGLEYFSAEHSSFLAEYSRKGGVIGDVVGILSVAWVVCAWHNQVIDANLRIYTRLYATLKVLRGLVAPASSDVQQDHLTPYLSVPLPPLNPYIKTSAVPDFERAKQQRVQPIPSRRLIRHVLRARADAAAKLATIQNELRVIVS